MNMHCLVAVARCRVQTRRYHCLINHTQSQRPSLRVPLPPPRLEPRALYPALISPLVSEPAEDSPCHPSELSTRFLSRCISLPLSVARDTAGVPHRPAAIDTNLRNFFGPATCHRVTAHPPTGVPSRTAGDREGVQFADVGEG